MPFIGNQPALSYTSFAKQDFTTSATTSYTLDNPVANENEIALFINFVRQEPTTAYTASGTSLTLTSATSASDDMYCVYLGKAVQTVTPASGSVTNSMLVDNTITSSKLSYPLTTFSSTGIDDNATSTAITIDSSERVGIGTASPENNLHIFTNNGLEGLTIKSTGNTSNAIIVDANRSSAGNAINQLLGRWNGTDVADIIFQTGSDTTNKDDGIITFRTSSANNISERMRIDSSGNLLVGVTAEPTAGDDGAQISNGSYHLFRRNTASSSVFRAFGSGSGEFRTLGNGNAQNTNNSYGAISDRELKENEVEANSQWNDIKALQIKNYNLKSQPNQTHLGVIAQDLEASGMNGVVEQNQDEVYSENDVLPEGKNIGDVKEKGYKTVKYSILYMKAVKALQEAMERIETLETQRADLEARITALENA